MNRFLTKDQELLNAVTAFALEEEAQALNHTVNPTFFAFDDWRPADRFRVNNSVPT